MKEDEWLLAFQQWILGQSMDNDLMYLLEIEETVTGKRFKLDHIRIAYSAWVAGIKYNEASHYM